MPFGSPFFPVLTKGRRPKPKPASVPTAIFDRRRLPQFARNWVADKALWISGLQMKHGVNFARPFFQNLIDIDAPTDEEAQEDDDKTRQ